jgi:hypothetical protein
MQNKKYAFCEIWPVVVGAYAVTVWVLFLAGVAV